MGVSFRDQPDFGPWNWRRSPGCNSWSFVLILLAPDSSWAHLGLCTVEEHRMPWLIFNKFYKMCFSLRGELLYSDLTQLSTLDSMLWRCGRNSPYSEMTTSLSWDETEAPSIWSTPKQLIKRRNTVYQIYLAHNARWHGVALSPRTYCTPQKYNKVSRHHSGGPSLEVRVCNITFWGVIVKYQDLGGRLCASGKCRYFQKRISPTLA